MKEGLGRKWREDREEMKGAKLPCFIIYSIILRLVTTAKKLQGMLPAIREILQVPL